VANYVTDLLRGLPRDRRSARLSVVVETESGTTLRVNYVGPPEGIAELSRVVRENARVMADIAAVAADWEALAGDCLRFCYMARAIEQQRAAIERLDSFEAVLLDGRRRAQSAGDGDKANMWLSMHTMLEALRFELQMFVELKEDRPDAAWDHLIAAPGAAAAALRAHSGAEGFATYSEHLFVHEENLFPPQVFMSPAMTVAHSECSICSSPYGECVHVAG
jgi:hypothetical protein